MVVRQIEKDMLLQLRKHSNEEADKIHSQGSVWTGVSAAGTAADKAQDEDMFCSLKSTKGCRKMVAQYGKPLCIPPVVWQLDPWFLTYSAAGPPRLRGPLELCN
eukprot:1157311-Pelagomonas_calceolata.AAC.2